MKLVFESDALGYDELLKEVFRLRMKAAKLKGEAKDLEESANDMFSGFRELTGVEEMKANVGTIRVVTRTTNPVDKDVLKKALLHRGVDSDIVADCFAEATKQTTSTSIGFYPAKEKKA